MFSASTDGAGAAFGDYKKCSTTVGPGEAENVDRTMAAASCPLFFFFFLKNYTQKEGPPTHRARRFLGWPLRLHRRNQFGTKGRLPEAQEEEEEEADENPGEGGHKMVDTKGRRK